MPTYRIPDVYVQEVPPLPPSVAEVATAIPAFIGHTEKATRLQAGDLHLKPTRIHNIADYQQYFGLPVTPVITVAVTTDPVSHVVTGTTVKPPAVHYLLYYTVKMFFDNGGGTCYIVACGLHTDAITIGTETTGLIGGLAAVALEDEPTLLVCPDALQLGGGDYDTMVQAMLAQCGRLKDRFAILDLFDGSKSQDNAALLANRARVGDDHLQYGALYYPYLKSRFNHRVDATESNVNVAVDAMPTMALGLLADPASPARNIAVYNAAKDALLHDFIVVPPSGAVAGVYAATDSARGVWKAPTNVGLADVLEPTVRLDNARQDALNVDVATGKSINALRAFAGKGTLVWGARTLAGNDNAWRYLPVRRFCTTVEESVRKSSNWVVFEPNDVNTWAKVRGMIDNYLMQKWREGALTGATPRDAFFVRCGLGTTMNAQDILEGRMNVEIGMAVMRPAEFIILRISHMLQTG